MVLYIFSALIVTGQGLWKVSEITLEQAKAMVSNGDFISAVGHPGTAQVLSSLLGVQIAPNRIEVSLQPGDKALAFKILGRLPEGRILSAEEVKAFPYKLYLVERLE